MRRALLPGLRVPAHPLHHPLDLPGGHVDAARLGQVTLSFLIAGFIRPFQTDQPRQCGRVASFQPQRGICGIMPLFFAGMVIVITLDGGGAEETLDLERFPPFAVFAGFGLVRGVTAVGGLLQEHPHQRAGRLEQGGAHQQLQLLDQLPAGPLALELHHQPLDFLVLGQEDFGREVFFLKPASRSARVRETTSEAYSPTSSWKRW